MESRAFNGETNLQGMLEVLPQASSLVLCQWDSGVRTGKSQASIPPRSIMKESLTSKLERKTSLIHDLFEKNGYKMFHIGAIIDIEGPSWHMCGN
jgi:hypothetical protein